MTDRTIPRDPTDDYSRDAIEQRQAFIRERTASPLEHTSAYSLDPSTLPGNIENFFGVAQVPIGLAGPILVNGEHAQGEFYVPLATTEGTLVASYSRGMKLCRLAGGITTTVVDDRMQRAPVFTFPSAREARDFAAWLAANGMRKGERIPEGWALDRHGKPFEMKLTKFAARVAQTARALKELDDIPCFTSQCDEQ